MLTPSPLRASWILALVLTVAPATPVSAQEGLTAYLGSLHDHTAEGGDDGKGDVAQALAAARKNGFQFFGLSPHNHMIHPSTYQALRSAVAKATEPGTFIPLEACEWGIISKGGHVGVVGAPELTTAEATDWEGFYGSLAGAATPPVVVLNHPKWAREFGGQPDEARMKVVHLMEMLGGPGHADVAEMPTRSEFYHDEFIQVLNQGWRCGVAYGEDDHTGSWGQVTRARMGAWAPELTREAVLESLAARRTFVTEDPGLSIWIAVKGSGEAATPMGSVVPGRTGRLEAKAVHTGGEAVELAVFFDRDGPGGETVEESAPIAGATHSQDLEATSAAAYVFVVARDASGDLCWSSPIWLEEPERFMPPPAGDFGTTYEADLNFSSQTGLMRVEGLGKGTAKRIEEARKNGTLFLSVEELRTVEGITPEIYEKLAPHLKVTTVEETISYVARLDRQSTSFVLVGKTRERLGEKRERALQLTATQLLLLIGGPEGERRDRLRASVASGKELQPASWQEISRRLLFLAQGAGEAERVKAFLE